MPQSVATRASLRHPALLGLACLLGLFEGADLAAMGPTLSRLSRLLHLDPAQAGLCASASLFGLVIGSTVGGRLADLYGRRVILLVSSLLLGVFSVATALSWDFHSLLTIRLLAGFGMGGMFPVLVAMGGDAAAPQFRARAISIVMTSGTVGAIVGGVIALQDDWRLVFLFGGVGPLVALPALFWLLPGPGRAEATTSRQGGATLAALLGHGRAKGTLLIWAISFCTVLASYIMVNWLPSLLLKQGLSEHASRVTAIVYAAGGVFGNLISGWVMDRGRPRAAYLAGYVGASACIAGLALASTGPLTYALVFAAACFILGAQLVTLTMTASFYPDAVRTTGIGAMVSAGRCGSVVGPLMAGQLLHSGFSAEQVFLSLIPGFALALALGLAFTAMLERRTPAQLASTVRLSDALG